MIASRGAPLEILFEDGFEGGNLDTMRWTIQTSKDGQAIVTTNFAPAVGRGHLLLHDTVNDTTYSRVIASFKVDLKGYTNVVLSFQAKSLSDEPHFEEDRVFVTFDSRTHHVASLAFLPSDYSEISIPLNGMFAQWPVPPTDSLLTVTFAQYDNFSAPLDGHAIDEVKVTGQLIETGTLWVEFPARLAETDGSGEGLLYLQPTPSVDTVVTLRSSDPKVLNVPETILVRAGESLAPIPFEILNGAQLTGPQSIQVEARAENYHHTQATIWIDDDERIDLTLIVPPELVEGDGNPFVGIVRIDHPLTFPLEVIISADPASRVGFGGTVISAGTLEAVFQIYAFDNLALDGDEIVQVSARSTVSAPVFQTTRVRDNERPTLTLQSFGSIREGAAPLTVYVQLGAVATNPLPVTFAAPAGVDFTPNPLIFPAETQSSAVTLSIKDDSVAQGMREVPVVLSAPGYLTSTQTVTIPDDDAASIATAFLPNLLPVGENVSILLEAIGTNGERAQDYEKTFSVDVVDPESRIVEIPSVIGIPQFSLGSWSGYVIVTNRGTGLRFRFQSGSLTSYSAPFDTYTRIDVVFRDIASDPTRNLIYASVAQQPSFNGDTIVIIDPAGGKIVRSLVVGDVPDQLVVTDDGSTLYVELEQRGEIAQVDLETFSIVRKFVLSSSDPLGPLFASDIETVRGHPNWLLAAVNRRNGLPPQAGVALFIDGVRQKDVTPDSPGAFSIERSADPDVYFSAVPEPGGFGLRRVKVSPTGVTELDSLHSFLTGVGEIVADGHLVFTYGGEVFDTRAKQVVARFSTVGARRPDLASGRIYAQEPAGFGSSSDRISVYDAVTFQRISEHAFGFGSGVTARRLIRYGTNGLALAFPQSLFLVESSRIVPTAAAADLACTVRGESEAPVVGEEFIYLVTITNTGPNTASAVLLTAALSQDQRIVSAKSTAGDVARNQNTISLSVGELAVGSVVTLELTVVPQRAGAIQCRASVTSSASDPLSKNHATGDFVAAGSGLVRDVVSAIRLHARDLVADPTRPLVYVSVPAVDPYGQAIPFANNVLALDPLSGQTVAVIPTGPDPGVMAVSGDGGYLYVALNGAGEIQRIDLSTFQTNLTFALGRDAAGGPLTASDIIVPSGLRDTVVVSMMQQAYPQHFGVAAFDNGVRRPRITPGLPSNSRIEPSGHPDYVFAYGSEGGSPGFRLLRLASEGVNETTSTSHPAVTFGSEIRSERDLLFTTEGLMFQGTNFTFLHNFGAIGTPLSEREKQRIYFLGPNAIYAFHSTNFTQIGSLTPLEGSFGNPMIPFIKWGRDGFAWIGNGQLFFVRSSFRSDSDSDGLDDDWETEHFGDLARHGTGDSDQDGALNRDEFVAGTDPRSSADIPTMSIAPIGSPAGPVQIEWIQRRDLNPALARCFISTNLATWEEVVSLTRVVSALPGIANTNRVRVSLQLPVVHGSTYPVCFARIGDWPLPGADSLVSKTLRLAYLTGGAENFRFTSDIAGVYEHVEPFTYTYDAAAGELTIRRTSGQSYRIRLDTSNGRATVTYQEPGGPPDSQPATYTLH